ncbi:MAG: acyl-CoA dehydrogenase family protein [Ilumatobacteraceae bacterium]
MTVLNDNPVPTDAPPTDWPALAAEIGAVLAPEAADNDRTGQISAAAFQLLRERGATTALIPREAGGGGATHAEFGSFLRELGRHDGPTAVTLSMHSHLVATQVWRHRHGMDASAFFAKVVGERPILISTGASDWVGSSGSATKVDGGYRVSARKMPASGCEVGDLLVTTIRWDDAPDGPSVIHCSIPFSADGVSIEQTWDTMGMRATGSHTVVLDDVFVPDAAVALVRPADVWHPIWNAVLGAAMPLIMSAYVGIADAAVDTTRAMIAGREDPHVLQLAGEMVNAHTTGADLVDAMLASSDNLDFANADEHSSRTLARKTVAADSLIDTIRLAIEATGGVGYTRHSVLERLYRDVHGCLFHPLPRAKQTRFSGRVAVGLSPIG